MANLILLIAILLAGTSYASFTAKRTMVFTEGHNWATNFCSSTQQLCKYPYEMAYAAAALVGLWLLLKFVSAIRN